jgi:carotenoid cleavage dioxygenase-like enzyme
VDNISDVPEGKELVTLDCSSASAVRQGKKIVLKPEALTKKGLELPCLNKMFIGKKYRYFYCTGNTSPKGYFENSLVKMDLETKTLKIWQGNEHCFAGEPVFIQNPDANENDEDNGVVLTIVVDSRKGSNDFLLFLDAKTFTEIGRAKFNASIPFLIHGLYLPS